MTTDMYRGSEMKLNSPKKLKWTVNQSRSWKSTVAEVDGSFHKADGHCQARPEGQDLGAKYGLKRKWPKMKVGGQNASLKFQSEFQENMTFARGL